MQSDFLFFYFVGPKWPKPIELQSDKCSRELVITLFNNWQNHQQATHREDNTEITIAKKKDSFSQREKMESLIEQLYLKWKLL